METVLKAFSVLLAAAMIGVFFVTVARADFQAGVKAYDAGDYAAAIAEWRPLADQGNLEAQFGMGIIYENGRGIGRDYTEASSWYTMAAEGGHPGAQFNLGNMYQQGLGVEKDPKKAVYWWTLAAAQGLSEAQLNLGIAYHRGDGVAVDQDEALAWFVRAAESGNPMGQFSAGYAFEIGLGTEPDIAKARAYYIEASQAGVQQAVTRLAALGPPTDDELAAQETAEETVVETVEERTEEVLVDERSAQETESVVVEETESVVVEETESVAVEETESVAVEDTVEQEVAAEPSGELIEEEMVGSAIGVNAPDSNQDGSAAEELQIPAGSGPYIQLAAYLSETRAEEAWSTFVDRYPDLLDGLPHRVQRADLGGENGTVYRLQAGPMPAQGEAQAICTQLKQRNADCLLVAP